MVILFFSRARVLTPSWILTILEHVVPVVPHGTFSVMTPKFSCTVLLPHLFFEKKDEIDLIMMNFMQGPQCKRDFEYCQPVI